MAEHTGESLPSSVEDSSISTGSVIDALVYAEMAQVQAFSVVTGSAALNAHAGVEATRDLIQQIRSSCKDLSLPFDKKFVSSLSLGAAVGSDTHCQIAWN